MLDKNNLVQLMKTVALADRTAPTAYSYNGSNFSYDQLNETLRSELNEYAGSYQAYRKNKDFIFEVLEEALDEVLPKTLQIAYGDFAEIKQFAQGDKPMFRRKINSRNRAKQFVTRVGLAGVYEVFKLGASSESFEVRTSAIGGAAQIGLEEFLDGRVDFAELYNIILEGMDELIYHEIGAALKGATGQLPAANRVSAASFDEAAFDQLVMIAASYGEPVIYCTKEFAVKMIPQEAWRYTEAMKDELSRKGMLAGYKGNKVVILEQGFTDETHAEKLIDPGFCWIIPNNAGTKPVKVALEGGVLVEEWKNHDWSREVQFYQKVGVVFMMSNDICVYVDESLAGQMNTWNLKDTASNVVVVDDGDNSGNGEHQEP